MVHVTFHGVTTSRRVTVNGPYVCSVLKLNVSKEIVNAVNVSVVDKVLDETRTSAGDFERVYDGMTMHVERINADELDEV